MPAWVAYYYTALAVVIVAWFVRRTWRALAAVANKRLDVVMAIGHSLEASANDTREALQDAVELLAPKRDRDSVSVPVGGSAWLEEVCDPLYATLRLNRRTFWPSGHRMRVFVQSENWHTREKAYALDGNEQIPSPRLFVAKSIEALCTCPETGESVERDRALLQHAIGVRLQIGARNYSTLPLASLPQHYGSQKITIPCLQNFFVELESADQFELQHEWRITIMLRGSWGREL